MSASAGTKKRAAKKAQPAKADLDALIAEAVAKAVAAERARLATPAAVAEATKTDPVQALVEEKGFAFARGGRAYLSLAGAQALVRVLRTGSPEIVEAAGEPSEVRRSVTANVVFRTESGAVAIHPLYRP